MSLTFDFLETKTSFFSFLFFSFFWFLRFSSSFSTFFFGSSSRKSLRFFLFFFFFFLRKRRKEGRKEARCHVLSSLRETFCLSPLPLPLPPLPPHPPLLPPCHHRLILIAKSFRKFIFPLNAKGNPERVRGRSFSRARVVERKRRKRRRNKKRKSILLFSIVDTSEERGKKGNIVSFSRPF